MPNTILKPEVVLQVYLSTINEWGVGSTGMTAKILGEMGYVNPVTHTPITKQAVLECLRKSEEGKKALLETSKRKWKQRYQ